METFKHFLLIGFLFLLVACNKDKEDEELILGVSTNDMTVDDLAQEQTVQVTSNQKWTASIPTDATWLTIRPVNGAGNRIITMNIEANDQSVPKQKRTAIISVTSGEMIQEVTVTQDTINNICLMGLR